MNVLTNVALAQYSTMGLGGVATNLTTVSSRTELLEALAWAHDNNILIIMIGGGSNIIWRDEGFDGLIIVNEIKGYSAVTQPDGSTQLTIGAGEVWDSVVARSIEAGLTGIEALSLIPGSTGAVPVQNVGAYGQEIAQSLVSLEAYDTVVKDFVTIAAADCGFAYRTSRFNGHDRGRFYIVSITLELTTTNPQPPYYGAVQDYLDDRNISVATPAQLREAVIAIRSARLPDPAVVHNTGSFFGNPIVNAEALARLRANYPSLPSWPLAGGAAKIPAAWLIEQAGFKDTHDTATGMGTWPQQPLVLVNEHAKTTADLLAFKQSIVEKIQAQFGITLKQEPELLPAKD